MVIHAVGSDVSYSTHEGPLSIKCAYGGREYYTVGNAVCAADDAGYVLLNDGQMYASTIPRGGDVESLCIFFDRSFVHDVLSTLIEPTDRLLDAPDTPDKANITFFDRRYAFGPTMRKRTDALRRGLLAGRDDPDWIDGRLRSLLVGLLQVHRDVRSELDALDAVRPSTRTELYRRLYHARDVIDACFRMPLTIEAVASVAYMSPYHFLRRFKQLFGVTPHAMLRRRRLEEACRILLATESSVSEVCRAVGFESTGTFTSLFTHVYGSPPAQWRQSRPRVKKHF